MAKYAYRATFIFYLLSREMSSQNRNIFCRKARNVRLLRAFAPRRAARFSFWAKEGLRKPVRAFFWAICRYFPPPFFLPGKARFLALRSPRRQPLYKDDLQRLAGQQQRAGIGIAEAAVKVLRRLVRAR